MAGSGNRLWLTLRAHTLASPRKSALLTGLTLVLVVLVVRQLSMGPRAADASLNLTPVPAVAPGPAEEIAGLSVEEVLIPASLPLPTVPERPQRDPFVADLSLFTVLPGTEFEEEEVPEDYVGQDPVEEAFAQMTLQSTVNGARAAASINGQVVGVGERMLGFTVRQIGARFVVLESGDRRFVLTME